MRWLNGYRDACDDAQQAAQTLVVSIADRESGVYEGFIESPEPGVG